MAKVEKWTLKVFEQKKTDNAVIMNTSLNGRKNDDGTYQKSMPISVVLNGDTKWAHADLSGKYVDVTGNFATSEYTTKEGSKALNFTIFADVVEEHVFEEKPTKSNNKKSTEW